MIYAEEVITFNLLNRVFSNLLSYYNSSIFLNAGTTKAVGQVATVLPQNPSFITIRTNNFKVLK